MSSNPTASDLTSRLEAALAALPLVAILRGLVPGEAVAVARRLYQAGFRLIEVPLNSPDPFDSIAKIREDLADDCLVGAGTVTTVGAVQRLASIKADLVVMPHADTTVISAGKAAGMMVVPGFFTATEAFAALAAGADALKIFPAELMPPVGVKALRAVLPPNTRLMPVGGVTPETMKPYRDVGVAGFGLGSALFKPGLAVEEIGERADRFAQAWAAIAG